MLKMKLWKYYTRRKTTLEPEMRVRCVGVYSNALVVQRPNGAVMFVPKNNLSLCLYSEEISLENK